MLLPAISCWRRNIAICPPPLKPATEKRFKSFKINADCFLGGCLIKNFDLMPQAKLRLIKK